MDSGETLLVRLTDPTSSPWPLMDVFAGRGLAELLIVPLDTADGPATAPRWTGFFRRCATAANCGPCGRWS